MDTTLNDAAFRLVSHGMRGQHIRWPETDEERLVVLRREFPDAGPQAIGDALKRAWHLEQTAIELADSGVRADDGRREPTRETLAEQCPGFSEESYGRAVDDGFVETR